MCLPPPWLKYELVVGSSSSSSSEVWCSQYSGRRVTGAEVNREKERSEESESLAPAQFAWRPLCLELISIPIRILIHGLDGVGCCSLSHTPHLRYTLEFPSFALLILWTQVPHSPVSQVDHSSLNLHLLLPSRSAPFHFLWITSHT